MRTLSSDFYWNNFICSSTVNSIESIKGIYQGELSMFIVQQFFNHMEGTLAGMQQPVAFTFFKPEGKSNDAYFVNLSSRLKILNPKLTVEVRTLSAKDEKAIEYGIRSAPAFVLEAKGKQPIRYFGIPVGEELNTMLSDILSLSNVRPGLSKEMNERVMVTTFPPHLKAFDDPKNRFASNGIRMAHNFSMLNHRVAGQLHPEVVMKKLSDLRYCP